VPDVLRSWEKCSTFQLEAPLSRGLCLVRVLSYLEGVTIKRLGTHRRLDEHFKSGFFIKHQVMAMKN
jgi:hypothetical protein